MKFISCRTSDGQASYGILRNGDEVVDLGRRLGQQAATLKALIATGQAAALASPHASASADHRLADLTLLPVIPDPQTIACVGHNYEEHRVEIPVYEWEDTSLMRVSIGPYNDEADVSRLANAVRTTL